MRKMTKKAMGVFMVMSLVFGGHSLVSAAEKNIAMEEVFPNEQVEQIIQQARERPIYNDKDEYGHFSLDTTRSFGQYPSRKGVILVTEDKYKGLIPTGHAAIMWSSNTVVESLSGGVTTGANDWNTSKNTCYAVGVSGTTEAQDRNVADWCYKQIGKPYNLNYLNVSTRGKFYCSQLVWAGFKDNYNINLNTSEFGDAIHPIELVNNSITYTIYRK